MKNKGILEKMGFSKEENRIYVELLSAGASSISNIVRKTGLHRPAVYKVLPQLVEKGLVTIMPKGKSKLYVAESPDNLEKIFTELEDDFNAEIHRLHQTYSMRDKKPIITFAEGKQAITAVYSDLVHGLKKGDTYYRYSSTSTLNRERFIPKDYRQVRDKKQLERLVITNEPSKKMHSLKLGRTIKAIPRDYDLFEYNISQMIYGDKVAFVDYNSNTTITIENKIIAEFQKKIFKLLFKKL